MQECWPIVIEEELVECESSEVGKGEEMRRRAKGEGSLLLLKGCSVYYAQFYRNGRQVRETTSTRVRQKALAILRQKMTRSEDGFLPTGELKKIRYADLRAGLLANYVEKGRRSLYHTKNGEETICGLKVLDAFFGFPDNQGPSVTEIGPDLARRFAKEQLEKGWANGTVNRALTLLRRMLSIAREDGKIQAVPLIRKLKEPPARKGFVSLPVFKKLLRKLPTDLHPLILFLYWCGVRLGEARAIEWSQVELHNRLIRLEEDQTKNEEARIVPLPQVLVMLLQREKHKTGRVFDDTNLRNEWQKACVAVGLGTRVLQKSASGNSWYKYSGLIIHDMRRSAVRNLVTVAGVPEQIAMKISGHKTRSVFDRYHIVNAQDVSNAMARLEVAARKSTRPRMESPALATPLNSLTAPPILEARA
jgi:integrase